MIDLSKHPLLETDWLAAHLGEPDLRLVDTRCYGEGDCRCTFLAGHIPGAVHLCWHLDLSYTADNVRYVLLPPDRFAAVMAQAGIGPGTKVVVYAEADHSGPARLWWALRYYGHDQVAVLNGGLTKWIAESRPVTTELIQPPLAQFTPEPQPQLLATAVEIEAILADPNREVCLMDTRPPEQYAGQAVWTPQGSLFLPPDQVWVEVEGRVMRGGHIPGAISLPAAGNLDPHDHWRYRSRDVLEARAMAVGIRPEQRVIAYCGSGISASQSLFSLYLAGYRDVALYDASWEEWGTDPTFPVERG